MKICIDISSLAYGTGVSRYTANLVRAVACQIREEDELSLFGTSFRSIDAIKDFGANENLPLRSYRLPPTLTGLVFNQTSLPIDALVGKVDVFHAWDWYAPATRSAKLVSTIHDMTAIKKPENTHPKVVAHHQIMLNRLKSNHAKVIAVSEHTKNDLVSLLDYNPELITVIYEALPVESRIDVSNEKIKKTLNEFGISRPYMLIVGTREPRKNLKRMIEAWKGVRKDYDLVVAGKGAWDVVTREQGIIYTDYVDDYQLASLYKEAACLLYCSLDEGFGLPILEGFYHNTPVVTSNIGSMPEVAGNAAILVDPYEADSILNGINSAIEKSVQLIRLGRKQLNRFDWDTTAKKTLDFYRKAVEG